MKGFVIFAIVVTVLYIIYYTVLIVQDLYGKPKDEAVKGETFDVSDMTDEDDSVTVSENEGGFSVGESQYQTAYEVPYRNPCQRQTPHNRQSVWQTSCTPRWTASWKRQNAVSPTPSMQRS